MDKFYEEDSQEHQHYYGHEQDYDDADNQHFMQEDDQDDYDHPHHRQAHMNFQGAGDYED